MEENGTVESHINITPLPSLKVSIGLEKLNRFKPLSGSLLSSNDMEPTISGGVLSSFSLSKEIMMMQQPVQAAPSKPIPQHIAERLESEWKQIRETAPVKPAGSR